MFATRRRLAIHSVSVVTFLSCIHHEKYTRFALDPMVFALSCIASGRLRGLAAGRCCVDALAETGLHR
ncbi:hypothetical protein BDI4_190058 [Burkholderia diffusa]|nr:hypothetical protein BDI4_190058 [Burkholderia diffusa]